MEFKHDPIGHAIHDYASNQKVDPIEVMADLCEDDIMPVPYLFRNFEMMPEIEQKALELCRGKILDVGAAAGCHASYLIHKGYDVTAIDTSKGAVDYLNDKQIPAKNLDFYDVEGQYDTVLILMNGIGLAGKLNGLPRFLNQIKKLIGKTGIALCDSTDLSYLYMEEDGSMWVDLNGSYHGEMQFKMKYKTAETEWFNWLYIDFDLLCEYAEKEGLVCQKVIEGPSNNYLVKIQLK